MAPIRRYLRITKHSVLECRIFLENPADGARWLLHPTDPALPRVFEAVKPYVLPKLREENERLKSKGKKKKSVKDVVQGDDFEVSVFLTQIRTRHALMIKNKTFQQREPIRSNSNKLTGGNDPPVLIEDDDDDVRMPDIPVTSGDSDLEVAVLPGQDLPGEGEEDKKKLAFTTTYQGFTIWGFVLCLLVERKGGSGKLARKAGDGNPQVLMEEWISTQQEQQEDS